MKIVKPEYTESIVNLMASIYNYYGGVSTYKSIECLDDKLKTSYQHVVLMVFDGLGYEALKYHLSEENCLRKHLQKPIQSVFPPTTTAAMTSYYSGLSPNEHGWLGWSLYFKEFASSIDLFTNRNSYTGKEMTTRRIAYEKLPYTMIYEKIKKINKNVCIHTIKPSQIYFPQNGNIHHKVDCLNDIAGVIESIQVSEEQTFIATYWPDPDMKMHEFGPWEVSVTETFKEIDSMVEKLSSRLKDTLLIVCADHGLTSIKSEINVMDYKDLLECIYMPPSIEGRAMSFFVKQEKREIFKALFEDYFGEDFVLYTKEDIRRLKLFGMHQEHERVDDFVGDYLACAIGSKLIYYRAEDGCEPHHFKGHHAGLTSEEMLIPLIIIECE